MASPNYYYDSKTPGKKRQLPKPYTVLAFDVGSWTNVGNSTIPRHFTVRNFIWFAPPGEQSKQAVLRSQLRFIMTNILMNVEAEIEEPPLSRPFQVYDYRFQERIGIANDITYLQPTFLSYPKVIEKFSKRYPKLA